MKNLATIRGLSRNCWVFSARYYYAGIMTCIFTTLMHHFRFRIVFYHTYGHAPLCEIAMIRLLYLNGKFPLSFAPIQYHPLHQVAAGPSASTSIDAIDLTDESKESAPPIMADPLQTAVHLQVSSHRYSHCNTYLCYIMMHSVKAQVRPQLKSSNVFIQILLDPEFEIVRIGLSGPWRLDSCKNEVSLS